MIYTQYTTYTTKEGDRWDMVANATYGDPYGYAPIVQANPQYRLLRDLPGAIALRVPVLTEPSDSVDPDLVPPWRR